MRMTIDESINWIKKTIFDMRRAEMCISDRLALETAIDTMRKYQKIEQILSDWINDDLVGMSDYWMGRIKEVVEDENVMD